MNPSRFLLILLVLAPASPAHNIPISHGTTLAGKPLVLPRDLPTKYAILIVGFTEKSSLVSSDWGKRIGPVLCTRPNLTCFEIPVLASVPRLFRGLVIRLMKQGVPEVIHPYFLPIFENEPEWKHAVSFAQPDDAYLLIVGQQGEVVWKTHGPFTEQRFQELKDNVTRETAALLRK